MKLSTLSSVSPATVRGASKVIHITYAFGALISSPTRLAACHTLSFLKLISDYVMPYCFLQVNMHLHVMISSYGER